MKDTLRETFVGQLVYQLSGHKLLKYPEEEEGFVVPERYQKGYKERKSAQGNNEKASPAADEAAPAIGKPAPVQRESSQLSTPGNDRFFDAHHDQRSLFAAEGAPTPAGERPPPTPQSTGSGSDASSRTLDGAAGTAPGTPKDAGDHGRMLEENRHAVEDNEKNKEKEEEDPYIVDWYGPNDPANPMNWSMAKRSWVTFNLCFLTFSVYAGSSIVTPGLEAFAAEHGIGSVPASLSISLFVLGYGIGPMFLSALSEIPSIGRNLPYIITLAIFVVLQVPTAIISSTAGFFILRFLAGVMGSPPLATGGATIADMVDAKHRAQWIGVWGLSAVCGPTLGPLIGGWAFQGTQDWRWTIWPILFASGGALILLFFTLPETSSTNILVRRAKRLRKLTGNDELRSAGEVAQAQMTGREVAMMTLVRPFLLTAVEPMVFLLNLQIGLVYAILYAWLEAFPLVFMGAYGFNSGELGLAFLSLFIGAVLTYAGFVVYCKLRLEPMFDKGNGTIQPEARLEPSFFGIWWLPICLFGFGWTSTASIHWIVPMIFASFFSIGTFLAFQSVLNYLSDSYPDYVASILAGNDLFRAAMGAALPLVARAMFNNLQANGPKAFPVAWGSTLLGCICLLFIPLPFVLHRYGPKLRQYSKYASYNE